MTTVLVVDDSAVERRLVGGLMQQEARWKVAYAENGSEALARIKEVLPDLVVTDLQMPELDGLDLVTLTRIHHPHLPVILITAYGSEALALEALERGAANYVPKSQLADRLVATAKEVLALGRARQNYEQLIGSLQRTEFEFCLDNDPLLIDPLVDLVQQMAFGMGLCDLTGRLRIGVALNEALSNALYHGNLEINSEYVQEARERLLEGEPYRLIESRRSEAPYRNRRIRVGIRLLPEEGTFIVRDEGPGFDVASIPDPGNPSLLEAKRGRGLSLMRAFMDDVRFNASGNEVTMTKRRDVVQTGTTAPAPK